jgi:hypothetical protein
MKLARIPLPELALLSVTRIAVGIGFGLLFGPTLDRDIRKKLGAVLLGAGAIATIPLAIDVIRRTRHAERMFGAPEMPGMPTGRTAAARTDAMAH